MKRVSTGISFNLTSRQAKELLRNKHVIEVSDGFSPWLELLELLLVAYPECESEDENGERVVDYRHLVLKMAHDFVPAFKPGMSQGRPPSRKDGLVEAVEALVVQGKSITSACGILERRNAFPQIKDIRQAYYRRKKKK